MYQCILCHGDLDDSSPSIVMCSDCGISYPIIDDINIFLLPDPFSSLQGFVMEMEETRHSFEKIIRNLDDFEQYYNAMDLSDRIAMTKNGLSGNTSFLEESCLPIMNFLQNLPSQDNTLAWSSVKSGFTFHDMLPYFYQDWSGMPDLSEVKALFNGTIARHCKDRDSVAVLGAGACGLLYSVAERFRVSYAVDLSLPTLLTAKKLIEGEPLAFHLEKADWQQINLTPPESTENDIRYIVSDVMNMPFNSDSLSVVITQYVLDIVSNPKRLSAEIYRVLKADGLWINFSNPFKVPGDPTELDRRRINELPDFFRKMGFDVVDMGIERFSLLNLEKLFPETGNTKQLVHFFTLRKIHTEQNSFNTEKPIQRFFRANEAIWWEVPRVVMDRELFFVRKKSFDQLGRASEYIEISVAGQSFAIPSDIAMLLEKIFEYCDGKNNLKMLLGILQKNGIYLNEEEFLQLIYMLNVQHYLIELNG